MPVISPSSDLLRFEQPALTSPGASARSPIPWMRRRRLHRLFGASRLFRTVSMGLSARLELALLRGHKDPGTLALIRQVRRERESLMSANEAFLLHSIAAAQSRLEGDMAEVGVYEGCSAKIISIAGDGGRLHLFDTFGGLPDPDHAEMAVLRPGQYGAALESVRAYLAERPNITLHPGEFPCTAAGCEDLRFSFVHLDVDLKASTRACLEFFYPRMTRGGIILTHDYSFLDGVKTAFDEFLDGRRERVIELSTSQAMIVKL